jgi:predicted nucleic acid-binding protein
MSLAKAAAVRGENVGSDKRPCNAHRAPSLAVLDTQVVLDWLVFRDISTAPLARSLELGSLRWLTSDAMQGELQHVLARGIAAAWGPDHMAISRVIGRLALRFEARDTPRPQLLCSDPDDQMFIDLALAAGAQWLFTRDRALLRLARRARERGVIVLRPADWHPSMPSANSQ